MKIAFVADTHFGYPRFEADASAQGRAAILDACGRADVLVLGGDIFDHRVPRLETLAEVAGLLQEANKILDAKWRGAQAPAADGAGAKPPLLVLGIHGTHERRAKDALNPIAMMAQLGLMADLHNKTVVVEKTTEPADGADGSASIERAAFSGLGGIPDDLVREALGRLSCKPAAGATNFFVLHQTMSEFVPAAPGLASLEDLPPGYDWYLCGHIHARAEYMGGKLLLPGSTVMTQTKDEEREPKGYYLVDTRADEKGGRGGRAEFVEIATRPFWVSELAFDKAQPADVRKKVEGEISRLLAQEWDDNPILKLRLAGSLAVGAGDLDLGGLESEKAYVIIDNRLDGGSLAADLEKLKEE